MFQNFYEGDWIPIRSISFKKKKIPISFNSQNINNINISNNKSDLKNSPQIFFKISKKDKIFPQQLIKKSSSSRNILIPNKYSFENDRNINISKNDSFNKTNDNILLLFQKNKQEKILPNNKILKKNLSYKCNENLYTTKNIHFFKKQRLNEIEKRSSYSNKVLKISKLKRIALNNYSILSYFANSSSIINPKSNNDNEIKKIEFEKNSRTIIPKLRNYLQLQSKFIQEKNKNLSFEQKNVCFPKINYFKKKSIKFFHNFKDLNGENRDLSKKKDNYNIKMTKQYMRDIQVLNSLNKIKDKNLIDELKNEYFN